MRWIAYLIVAFVAGLEAFCALVGFGLSDMNPPPEVWEVWRRALWAIPVAGLLAAWVFVKRPGRVLMDKAIGLLVGFAGGLLAFYWGALAFHPTNGSHPEILMAAMALMPALLLCGAGVKLLFAPRA